MIAWNKRIFSFSYKTGNESVGNESLVFLPVVSVLFGTKFVVSNRSVDQQNQKVEGIIVGNNRIKAAQEAVGESHHVIPGVIDLSGGSPPAACQQASSTLGGKVCEVGDARIIGIAAEDVLLSVG